MISEPENIQFPQYRKYKNGLSYFKIISEEEFEELILVNSKVLVSHIVASRYPEKVRVREMLTDYRAFAEEITAQAYEDKKRSV